MWIPRDCTGLSVMRVKTVARSHTMTATLSLSRTVLVYSMPKPPWLTPTNSRCNGVHRAQRRALLARCPSAWPPGPHPPSCARQVGAQSPPPSAKFLHASSLRHLPPSRPTPPSRSASLLVLAMAMLPVAVPADNMPACTSAHDHTPNPNQVHGAACRLPRAACPGPSPSCCSRPPAPLTRCSRR